MKKLFQLLSMVLFVVTTAQTLPPSGANATENYVYSRTYLQAVTSSNATAKQVQSISYFDGLGRPKQNIGIKATPQGRDIVTPIVYDGFGRQTREYLPIPQSNTTNGAIYFQNSGLVNYPVTDPTNIYSGEKIYAEKNLENSPLDRVLQQYQVGNDWSNKPINFTYETNAANEVFKFITLSTYSNYTIKSKTYISIILGNNNGYYPPSTLYKNKIIDEDNSVSIEFKNGLGQTIMSRKILSPTQNADTYYVYNEYNQLVCVIPPLASIEAMRLNDSIFDQLCYQYVYDIKNRLVEKKLPGKGWEYMVYDKQDRLVATQDANMRASNQWLYTKYDQFGRVAFTGMFTGGTRVAEQTAADNAMANNVQRSSTVGFSKNGLSVYYTAGAYPPLGAGGSILSVNYYDTYPADMVVALPTNIQRQNTLSATPTNNRSTKGLPTASYVKNIEDDNWTRNYTFYDTKARAIGNYSKNHLGGYTRTETVLDFAGVPQNTFTYHKRVSSDTEKQIKERFVYDSQNRLLQHYHQVNTNAEELLASNVYNELGQVEKKNVGNTLASPVQTVDYKYNIRGWLTHINNPTNLGRDLFGYEIRYQNPDSSKSSPTAKYNGNISQTTWITGNDYLIRTYTYQYDKLNRLTGSRLWDQQNLDLGEYQENLSYDLNGNIRSLFRTGSYPYSGATAPEIMDDLQYNYENNNQSNRLSSIREKGTGNALGGYPLAQGQNGQTINYDLNGNMIDQKDKNITSIKYNYLNLPTEITASETVYAYNGVPTTYNSTTKYIYNAAGEKLRKIYTYYNKSYNAYMTMTTDYLNGFQYNNGRDPKFSAIQLRFIPTSEGYVSNNLFGYEPSSSVGNLSYIYQYKDHLGNVRVSYDKNRNIVDESNYYPFGLEHAYNKFGGNQNYQYKYNGKELQETGMYDYGARFYMPDIGRWGVSDGKGELYLSKSPYSYANNTPVNAIDPDGNLVIFINGQHRGSGGSPDYWRSSKPTGYMTLNGGSSFAVYSRFDQAVMRQLNDNNPLYRDGAMGGFSNTAKILYDARDYGGNNLFSSDRISAGFAQGKKDATEIIKNLARDETTGAIVETIKIITHSMGGAYGKGYVKALKEYISTLPKEQQKQIKITLVADFDPFQAGSFSADSNIYTQQFIHKNADGRKDSDGFGWLANEKEKGADYFKEDTNEAAHGIAYFFNNINNLQEGTYKWNGSSWECTTCK